MAGQRHKDFRSGDINEELGILLLKGLCAVAAVPRPEDTGVDAICTVLLEGPKEILVAKNSFYVQFKSKSVDPVEFKPHEINWLRLLELPFFIGSVDPDDSSIELYPMHALNALFLGEDPPELNVFLKKDAEKSKKEGKLVPGEPLLKWSIKEFRDDKFVRLGCQVLIRYLSMEMRNISMRPYSFVQCMSWKTGTFAAPNGYRYALDTLNNQGEINAMQGMYPHVKLLATAAQSRQSKADYDFIIALMDYMKKMGVDPDIDNIQRSIQKDWDKVVAS